MADVTVPDEVKKKFPDLVELIFGSESMNDEERQYWLNILPIMTPPQILQLKDVLTNEREQLKAIDQKYAKEIDQIGKEQFLKQVEDARRRRRESRAHAESSGQREESGTEEEILRKIAEA